MCSGVGFSGESVKDYVTSKFEDGGDNLNVSISKGDAMELEADINCRKAKLDARILKEAFSIANAKRASMKAGLEWKDPPVLNDDDEEEEEEEEDGADESGDGAKPKVKYSSIRKVNAPVSSETAIDSVNSTSAATAAAVESNQALVKLFSGLSVIDTPFMCPEAIKSFESARQVFLMAVGHIELAKKIVILDGE